MTDSYYQYIDNHETGMRSAYSPDGEMIWRIPGTELQEDEPEFGYYGTKVSGAIIHEEEDEPPFHELLNQSAVEVDTVRQLSITFEDFPNNNDDPQATLRVTEWANGEGFDVAFSGGIHTEQAMFSLTYSRFQFIAKLVEQLYS